jgi:hypothetical protein
MEDNMNNDKNNKVEMSNIEPEIKESIVACKNVKIIMKLVDDGETFDLFSEIKKDEKK